MDKQRERSTVEAFLALSGLSDASMHEWNRERPDAIIAHRGHLVGIEVTKLSEAQPRQAISPQKWWAEANRIVEAARIAFKERHPDALVVRFELHPGWNPPNRDSSACLAQELAGIVEQAVSEPPAFARPGQPISLHHPHPEVVWAYVGTTRKELGGHWQPSFAHDVRRASAADIQHTVGRKEAEVETYRKAAPTVWLLIDCDLSGQGIALDVPTPDFAVTTKFDRVFCCGFGMWQWAEIPTTTARTLAAG